MEQPADRSSLRRSWPWLVGLAVLSVYAVVVCIGRLTHGFIAYYAAARLLFDGQLEAHVFDDVWFTAYVQRLTGTGVLEIYGPNTPMMAWAATPVVLFPPLLARALWIAGSIAAFVGSLLWLARTARNYVPPLVIILRGSGFFGPPAA